MRKTQIHRFLLLFIMLSLSWLSHQVQSLRIGGRTRTTLWSRFCTQMSGIDLETTRKLLHRDLIDWRKRTADELQRPIYQILSNQLIETIAQHKPKDLDQLSLLPGIGKFKLKQYGKKITDLVHKHAHPDDPVEKKRELEAHDMIDSDSFWDLARAAKAKKAKPAKKKTTATATGEEKVKEKKTTKRKKKPQIKMLTEEELAELSEVEPEYKFEDLNDEQRQAANHILTGVNVFITGSAGTGKSFLLRYVIQELLKKHGEECVAVTGPTGISAINIGGQTVHSFSGIGLGNGDTEKLISKVMKNKSCVERWLRTKVLIIDEISMLDRKLFELLDEIARHVRKNDSPFGGMQVIVVGDFMQLPPVRKEHQSEDGTQLSHDNFCFQSHVWEAAGFNARKGTIYLENVVRQTDEEFVQFLNEIRVGILSPSFQRKLQRCLVDHKPKPTNGIVPTKLYAVNKQVDDENNKHLNALPGEMVIITAEDRLKKEPSKSSLDQILKEGIEKVIPEKISLKVGAQVMLLRNRSRMTFGGAIKATGPSLVNGSRGKIISFTESVQRPGMMIPTVLFDNGMVTTIGPVEYTYRGPGGDGEIVRYQVPLKLAWASTVHKSQGCTLTCAELMLDKAFDYGQAYVALSRVKNLAGLWLSRPLAPTAVKAHPEVLRFYGYLD